MNKEIRRLPDAELEIMLAVWSSGEGVSSAYILERIKESRGWSLQTLLTVLSRLVDKGFLAVEKRGRSNFYHALVAQEVYKQAEGKSILERVYGNSFKSLIASLYQGKAISKSDLQELHQFIEELKEEE